MCAICTAYRVLWEVIDVVQVVAAQAVGRGLWQLREGTNIRLLRSDVGSLPDRLIKTNDFMIFPLKFLQLTHGGSQRHGWGVG